MLQVNRPHYHSCENPPASSPYQHSQSTILNGPNHFMPDPHNSNQHPLNPHTITPPSIPSQNAPQYPQPH
ncbi:hypothetical protein KC19_2G081100 [Ceratodon purpureus]|uniref:Uncharacterized protein n=1 Tax=Ceratodon purpureus TaxID=3225 RepID=A0A8T0IUG0_CERPU|nr:hypothetical protein KC19_2G081100 [Ceratodon purpureus]